MAKAEQKRDKLLDLAADGRMPNKNFLIYSAKCRKEISAIEEKLTELRRKKEKEISVKERLRNIRKALSSIRNLDTPAAITPALVDALIECIDVTAVQDQLRLDIHLCTGTTQEVEMSAVPRVRNHSTASDVSSVIEGSLCFQQHTLSIVRPNVHVAGHYETITYITRFCIAV